MQSRNDSVRKFLDEINNMTVRSGAVEALSREIRRQAQRLADDIRAAAPVKTGRLRGSVRVEEGKKSFRGGPPLQFIVKAGGAATTVEARAGSGASYDYSLATEFGTQHETAQPFFFPTAKRDENKIARAIEKTANDEFGRGGLFS